MAIDLDKLPDQETPAKAGPDLSKLPDQGPDLDKLPDKAPSTVGEVVKSSGESVLKSMKTIGQAVMPRALMKEATTPIPPLKKLGEKADTALSKAAEKVTPTEEDVVASAEKTGEIPYGKILERTAGQTAAKFTSGMIPRTPADIAMLAGPKGVSEIADGMMELSGRIVDGILTGGSLMDAAMKPGISEMIKEVPDLKIPAPADLADDAVRVAVGKKTVAKLQPSAIKEPEEVALDKETEGSPVVKKLGVPPALVDSSPKMKGTLDAPAIKPEIVPGTNAFSWEVYDRLAVPAAEAVSRQGQNGMLLANDMRFVRDAPKVRYGMEFGAPFEQLHRMVPTELREAVGKDLADALEGKGKGIASTQMVDFVRKSLHSIAEQAKALGMQIYRADGTVVPFAEREKHFPHMITEEALEKIIRDDQGIQAEIAKHLVKSKQSPHFSAALEQVKLFRKNLIDRKFGSLERSREMDLPDKFYERDAFKVIPRYMRTAYQRLAEVRIFGLNDAQAIEKIDGIAEEGKDADLALRTYRRFTGRDPIDSIAKGAFQALKNWATGSMIKFQTTLYHIPRLVYPAFETGYLRAAKAFAQSFGEASDLEAIKMGTNLTHAMSEYLGEEYGTGRGLSGKFSSVVMEAEGIRPLDRFCRKFSAILGRDWIENELLPQLKKDPFSKKARESLISVGINPDEVVKNKGLSEMELNVGAKRFSDRIQGNPDVTNIPLWASSPAGKMYFQFHNFIFVISHEIENIIVRAAKTGDVATLGRVAAGWAGAGFLVHSLRQTMGMKDNKYVDNPALNRALNIARDGVPMPIVMEMAFKIMQGKRGVEDMLIPPAIGEAADILGDMGQIVYHRKLTHAVKKDLIRKIPAVGTYLAHQQP